MTTYLQLLQLFGLLSAAVLVVGWAVQQGRGLRRAMRRAR